MTSLSSGPPDAGATRGSSRFAGAANAREAASLLLVRFDVREPSGIRPGANLAQRRAGRGSARATGHSCRSGAVSGGKIGGVIQACLRGRDACCGSRCCFLQQAVALLRLPAPPTPAQTGRGHGGQRRSGGTSGVGGTGVTSSGTLAARCPTAAPSRTAIHGAGGRAGYCDGRPTACDTTYQPVCGCDGKIHPDKCETGQAGLYFADVCDPGLASRGRSSCSGCFCDPASTYCLHGIGDTGDDVRVRAAAVGVHGRLRHAGLLVHSPPWMEARAAASPVAGSQGSASTIC